jgi:translocation and assembly module TamB
MLSRLLTATALAAVLVSGGAIAFLRTDFVANNLCAYAVATIEEATAAQVRVARCSVDPAGGKLTIEGLQVGDPGGRLDLKIARVFVHVVVRPLLQRVRLERLEIDHPELHLRLDQAGKSPPMNGGQCLPEVLDRFELGRVKVRKASVEIRSDGVRVTVPHASVAIKGSGELLRVALATRGGAVELPGRSIGLISSRTVGKVDLHGAGSIELVKADLIGAEASAFISGKLEGLCDPRIEATANVRVDDLTVAAARLLPGALTGVKGALSADASVTVVQGKPRVKGDLKVKGLALEGYLPGDLRTRFNLTPASVHLDRLDVSIGRGAVSGSIDLSLAAAALPVSADLTLRDVELSEVLRKLDIPHSLVVLRASGKAQLKGTLSPVLLGGEVGLDTSDFAVLDRPYEHRAQAVRLFEIPRAHLATAIAISPDKVVLRKTALDLGPGGRSHVQLEGTFYTDVRKGMLLLGHTEALDLDDFRGHIGPLPARGASAFAARVTGPYHDLHIEGQASVQDFHLLDLSLGTVATQVDFRTANMKLLLDQIRGRKDRSSYTGRVALDLDDPRNLVDAHLELPDAYLHDLIDLAVGLVPTLSTVSDRDDVDGRVRGVIDAHGPVTSPDGTARLELADVSLWDQTFKTGRARLTLHGTEPRLQVDELVLEHGDAKFLLGGRFGPDWTLDMDGHTEQFTLADLDASAPARLTGPLQATVHIGGVADHPLIDTAVKFEGGKAGKALLGDGDLGMKVDGKVMTWHGTIGTHTLDGRGSLLGTFPYTSRVSLRVPDLIPYLEIFAPGSEIQSGAAAADVQLEGSLLKWRDSTATVQLQELKVVRNDLAFENDGLGELTFGPAGLTIQRLALRAPYTTAQLSGSRDRAGKLDLRLNASVDGRLLQGLVPDVEHASGTWLVQAAVGGTSRAPTVLGNLRIEDAAVQLRGLPVSARALNGSISFSQDALVIDEMSGKLNNGEARLSGGIELSHLSPTRIDMSAHVSDVNVKFNDSLGATLDGDLTLFGPPLEPVLGGSLIVSRMKYTEDLDIEKSLLDFSRRPPAPRVLTRSAVLVHFDLDVHLSRGVRVENNLARTDLKGDLKVTGNSRALGLLGSVNSVHGTAQFRGNEFQIEQGVLSFTDRQRIRPSFDFQASSDVKVHASSDVKEYKVRMHAFGTPSEPHLALSSDPALAEADLGFLLTFGFVSSNLQQSTFSAADSGLAIGVEALNKVTGFSEEVRRFIPKNAILRDPNIDFASDFSSYTNRLEPMARFSSHLVNDKLDLKVLEGLTTRRYRGVVSYQLSDALSARLQLDNEKPQVGTDFGVDLHLKWEGD